MLIVREIKSKPRLRQLGSQLWSATVNAHYEVYERETGTVYKQIAELTGKGATIAAAYLDLDKICGGKLSAPRLSE